MKVPYRTGVLSIQQPVELKTAVLDIVREFVLSVFCHNVLLADKDS